MRFGKWQRVVPESQSPGVAGPGIKPRDSHVLTVCPWLNHLPSLSFSVLIREVWIKLAPAS